MPGELSKLLKEITEGLCGRIKVVISNNGFQLEFYKLCFCVVQ